MIRLRGLGALSLESELGRKKRGWSWQELGLVLLLLAVWGIARG